jgi:hypothetical protein
MLYIANATRQHRVFLFRSPEVKRPQRLDIPSGRQVAIGSSWASDAMQCVIEQLETYGAKRVADVRGSHLSKFHGLIYSLDKPVDSETIKEGNAAVIDHQERRAAAEAAKGAAAVDLAMRDPGTGKRIAKSTSVSIKQDLPKGEKPSKDNIAMDVTVDETGGSLLLPE